MPVPAKQLNRRSPYLRKDLFQAALVASFNGPVYNTYYLKKRDEEKHLLTCIGAVSRKLCNIIYAVLRGQKSYEVKIDG